jgi:uncharacterized caspase-like protein
MLEAMIFKSLDKIVYLNILLLIFTSSLTGCADTSTRTVNNSSQPPTDTDDMMIVDCLLPGQIRRLGNMTYSAARRPIKTSARECEIRGGEYVAYDRSNYATALNVWLPQAQGGDKIAQTYVGEIFERGANGSPQFDLAAQWYRKAAEQGYARAQINLGNLYEKGLGVKRDPATALNWYRKASGVKTAIALDPGGMSQENQQELEKLREEIKLRKEETAELRQKLAATQNEMEQSQKSLNNKNNDIETYKRELEQLRLELERRKKEKQGFSKNELEQLESELSRRETELQGQYKLTSRLQEEIEQLESETQEYNRKLENVSQEQIDFAEPSIEIIAPTLTATRGVKVSAKALIAAGEEIVGVVSAPAGLASLTINQKDIPIKENGLFRTIAPGAESQNKNVEIIARDNQGKSTSISLTLTARQEKSSEPKPLQATLTPAADFGTYHALIIGNNNYTELPKLQTAVNDARKLDEIFRKKYSFKTTVLLNATRNEIFSALNKFRAALTDKDNFLLYYAGHGHLEQAIARGYWLPVDAAAEDDTQWIPVYAITDQLNLMAAKQVIVIADSCYSGTLTRSSIARLETGKSEEVQKGFIREMAKRRSRTALTSGGVQPVLDVGGGDHSVFAKALITVLEENSDVLEGIQLYRKIRGHVLVASENYGEKQVPEYAPIRAPQNIEENEGGGDFFFVPNYLK